MWKRVVISIAFLAGATASPSLAQTKKAVSSKRAQATAWSATDSARTFVTAVQSAFLGCELSGGLLVSRVTLMNVQGATTTATTDTIRAGLTCRDSLRGSVDQRFRPIRDSLKVESAKSAFKEFYAATMSAIDALYPLTSELTTTSSSASAIYQRRIDAQADLIRNAANKLKSEM